MGTKTIRPVKPEITPAEDELIAAALKNDRHNVGSRLWAAIEVVRKQRGEADNPVVRHRVVLQIRDHVTPWAVITTDREGDQQTDSRWPTIESAEARREALFKAEAL